MLVGCLQRNNQMWSETVITFWLPWCNTCTSEYNSRRPASKSCYISMIMMLMTKLVFYWISFSATGIILQEEETGPLLRSCLIAFWSRHHMATHILSPTDWSSTALFWKTTTSWRDVPRSWTRRSSMQSVQMNTSKRWESLSPSLSSPGDATVSRLHGQRHQLRPPPSQPRRRSQRCDETKWKPGRLPPVPGSCLQQPCCVPEPPCKWGQAGCCRFNLKHKHLALSQWYWSEQFWQDHQQKKIFHPQCSLYYSQSVKHS